jgi:hypothetical protein
MICGEVPLSLDGSGMQACAVTGMDQLLGLLRVSWLPNQKASKMNHTGSYCIYATTRLLEVSLFTDQNC